MRNVEPTTPGTSFVVRISSRPFIQSFCFSGSLRNCQSRSGGQLISVVNSTRMVHFLPKARKGATPQSAPGVVRESIRKGVRPPVFPLFLHHCWVRGLTPFRIDSYFNFVKRW